MSSPNETTAGSADTEKRKMRDEIKGARGDAKGFAKDAKHAAADAAHDAKEGLHAFGDDLFEEGHRLTGQATDEVYRFADGRKTAAADALHDLAKSVRDSAEAFEDRPNLQAFFDSAAQGLDGFASSVHDRSFAQLYSDAEEFARQRPVTVAAGGAFVGLLLTRLARSSGLRARLEEERQAARKRWAENQTTNERSARDL